MAWSQESINCGREQGRKLRQARERAGLTQAEVSRRAGVGQSNVCQYEQGKRFLSLVVAQRLARALGLTGEMFSGQVRRVAVRTVPRLTVYERRLGAWVAVRVPGFWQGEAYHWNELLEDMQRLCNTSRFDRRDAMKRLHRKMESKGVIKYLGQGKYSLTKQFWK